MCFFYCKLIFFSLVCAVLAALINAIYLLLPLFHSGSVFYSSFRLVSFCLGAFFFWFSSHTLLVTHLGHCACCYMHHEISIVCLHWVEQTTLKINHLPSKKYKTLTHTRTHTDTKPVCMNEQIFKTTNKTLFGIANDIDTTAQDNVVNVLYINWLMIMIIL